MIGVDEHPVGMFSPPFLCRQVWEMRKKALSYTATFLTDFKE